MRVHRAQIFGDMALHKAARYGSKAVALLLMERGADLNVRTGVCIFGRHAIIARQQDSLRLGAAKQLTTWH